MALRNVRTAAWIVGITLALANLGGCCSFTEASNRIVVNAKAKTQNYETPNCGLNSRAPIQNAVALYNDQILQCSVEVLSTEEEAMHCEYMFEWYDQDSHPIKDTSGWNNLILDAGARKTLASSSPKPGAEKVVFSLRPVKAIGTGQIK
jgi:uncharacterized protein YcfL